MTVQSKGSTTAKPPGRRKRGGQAERSHTASALCCTRGCAVCKQHINKRANLALAGITAGMALDEG